MEKGRIGNLYKGGKAATGAACYSGWGYVDLMRPAPQDAGEEKWYHGQGSSSDEL